MYLFGRKQKALIYHRTQVEGYIPGTKTEEALFYSRAPKTNFLFRLALRAWLNKRL